jgi:hypothetical protein
VKVLLAVFVFWSLQNTVHGARCRIMCGVTQPWQYYYVVRVVMLLLPSPGTLWQQSAMIWTSPTYFVERALYLRLAAHRIMRLT